MYEKETNLYKRIQNNVTDIDKNNSTEIKVKNLVIQLVEKVEVSDSLQRFSLTMIGTGKAYILRDGQVVEGTWKKGARTSRNRS